MERSKEEWAILSAIVRLDGSGLGGRSTMRLIDRQQTQHGDRTPERCEQSMNSNPFRL